MLLLNVVDQSVFSLMIRGQVWVFDRADQSIIFYKTKVLPCSEIQLLLTCPNRQAFDMHIQYHNLK
jgi:hypothetical protein